MAKTLSAQRDEVIELQLRGIRETLDRLETSLSAVVADLGTVRIDELTRIRNAISSLEGDLKVLQYQARRSGATAGAWISAVISVSVTAAAALLLKH